MQKLTGLILLSCIKKKMADAFISSMSVCILA